MTVTTNEWIEIKEGVKPWKGREVLVRMSDGTKQTLVWNGMYWCEPLHRVRQFFAPQIYPTHFYIFEKLILNQQ